MSSQQILYISVALFNQRFLIFIHSLSFHLLERSKQSRKYTALLAFKQYCTSRAQCPVKRPDYAPSFQRRNFSSTRRWMLPYPNQIGIMIAAKRMILLLHLLTAMVTTGKDAAAAAKKRITVF